MPAGNVVNKEPTFSTCDGYVKKIKAFWQLAISVIEKIMNYPLQFCARTSLLSDLAAGSFIYLFVQ